MGIEYLIMDVDGTLTDGKIYIGQDGEIMKAFSVKDGYAISSLMRDAGVQPVIITARESQILINRCKELGIERLIQGQHNKLETVYDIVGKKNLDKCAYFGDDRLDLECMKNIKDAGGIVGCPVDAIHEVKAISNYVCVNKGGEGALREFVEWMLSISENDTLEERIKYAYDYLQDLDSSRLIPGTYIVNDQFYYKVVEYTTLSPENIFLESHRKHVDIQLVLAGEELMYIEDVSRLHINTPYDDSEDRMLWKFEKNSSAFTMKKGDVSIIYPNKAHQGGISTGEISHVLKVIGKVQCNW